MAVEVMQARYLFLPGKVEHHKRSKRVDFQSLKNTEKATRNASQAIPQTIAAPQIEFYWSYNPLHDLESLWWTAKYFVDNKDTIFVSPEDEESVGGPQSLGITQETALERAKRLHEQYAYARTLFHHPGAGRLGALVASQTLPLIHPCLVEAGVPKLLDNIRLALHQRYCEVEKDLTQGGAQIYAGEQLYETFEADLASAVVCVEELPALVEIQDLAPVAIKSGEESRPTTPGDLLASVAEHTDTALGPTQTVDPAVPAPVKVRKPRTKQLPLPTDRRLRSAEAVAT